MTSFFSQAHGLNPVSGVRPGHQLPSGEIQPLPDPVPAAGAPPGGTSRAQQTTASDSNVTFSSTNPYVAMDMEPDGAIRLSSITAHVVHTDQPLDISRFLKMRGFVRKRI